MLLIDGTAFVHRAYHSLHYKNHPMDLAAVLGTVRMLRRVLEKYNPDYVAIAMDSPGCQTFRHACYPGYKQRKKETPEDFKKQLPYAFLAVQALGLKLFSPPNWEADDVLASLAFWARSIGHPVTIVSGDKDLLQLVSPGIQVYDSRLDRTYVNDNDVIEKLGVLPRQVPDYLGLVGDPTDCIPGVKSIGPKTAVKLLSEGLGLEELLAKAEQESDDKLSVRLLQQKNEALLSKFLATLRVDVDLGTFTIEDLRRQRIHAGVLNSMLPNSGWDR